MPASGARAAGGNSNCPSEEATKPKRGPRKYRVLVSDILSRREIIHTAAVLIETKHKPEGTQLGFANCGQESHDS